MKLSLAAALITLTLLIQSLGACATPSPPPVNAPAPPDSAVVASTISGTVSDGSGSNNVPFSGTFTVTCKGLDNNATVPAKTDFGGGKYECRVSPGQRYLVRAEADGRNPAERFASPGDTGVDLVLMPRS